MGKWEEKKLGEIAKTQSGGTPSRGNKAYWGGRIPWLKSGELNDNLNIIENSEFITDLGLQKSSAKLFKKGTLLLAMYGATAGKLGILGINAATNQAVCSIQNIKGLFDEKYIFYFLLLSRKQIIKDSFGGAQPNISKSYIDNLKIPLPPLSVQKQIVTKLDALFARIDKSIALLEENIQLTKDLMASVLDGEFNLINNEEFVIKKLGEVCNVIGGGTPKTNVPEYWNGDIKWLSPTDLPPIGVVSDISKTKKTITKLGLDKSSAKLLPKGSLVFSSRASIGKIGICKIELATNQGFTNFLINDNIDVYYLAYILKRNIKRIEELSNSTTFKEVSKTNIKNFEIPLIPIEKQKIFAKKIIKTEELSNKLLTQQAEKLKYLQSLKSSLLDRAFKGELV